MPINKNTRNKLETFLNNNPSYDVFIETGLKEGESISLVSKMKFKKLFSIEYNEKYLNNVAKKEKIKQMIDENRLELILGDSGVFLEKTINDVSKIPEGQDVIIYLDAHDHSVGGAPLENEMKALSKYKGKFLLLIDDMWFIENAPTNPNRAGWATRMGSIERFYEIFNSCFQHKNPSIEKIYYNSKEKHGHQERNYVLWVEFNE